MVFAVQHRWRPCRCWLRCTARRMRARTVFCLGRPAAGERHALACPDMVLIERVLVNLLENATKYTPTGAPPSCSRSRWKRRHPWKPRTRQIFQPDESEMNAHRSEPARSRGHTQIEGQRTGADRHVGWRWPQQEIRERVDSPSLLWGYGIALLVSLAVTFAAMPLYFLLAY